MKTLGLDLGFLPAALEVIWDSESSHCSGAYTFEASSISLAKAWIRHATTRQIPLWGVCFMVMIVRAAAEC